MFHPTRKSLSLAARGSRLSFALLGGLACAARSQSISTATLNGTVHDPSGASVPNATVEAKNATKGFDRTVHSDADGKYELLQLPPGTYSVTVSAPNFSKLIQNNVVLTVGEQADLPLTLTVGGDAQTVTVNAEAQELSTETSSQGSTVDQVAVTNLPINGRNYINFTLTNSQVLRDAAPAIGPLQTSGLNIGGGRARSNSVNLDGVDVSDYASGGARATLSQDAVQEFQVTTNGFNAEFGRSLGGLVNIVSKSGSNETHGSAFAFLRNRYIQATNPFSTVYQPAYTRVQAGATAGGALKKDRTFYFFGAEITRRQETGFSTIGRNNFGLVPIDASKFFGAPAGAVVIQGTPAQRTALAALSPATPGIQNYIALVGSGSGIATKGTNPGFVAGRVGPHSFLASGAPLPASFTPLNNLIGNFPISEKSDLYSFRIDHKLSDNQQLVGRATASPSLATGVEETAFAQALGQNSFSRTGDTTSHDWSILVQHTWILGPDKVNEVRYGFARHPFEYTPNSNAPGSSSIGVNIPGFAYFGETPFASVRTIQYPNQLTDNFTYTHAGHTIKFGVDLRYVHINQIQTQTFSDGDYIFGQLPAAQFIPSLAYLPALSPIQAYGLGVPQIVQQSIGRSSIRYNDKILGAFLQDSYKLKRLTVNYGLRYDVEGFPLQPSLNANTTAAETAFGVSEGVRSRLNDFSPRLGFALDATGDGKTVLRGNFGIYYDRVPGTSIAALNYNTYSVPIYTIPGGAACTAATVASPLNLNATNLFQGVLNNSTCLGASAAGLNYLPQQQRLDSNNINSTLVNQNYLAANFPLATLPTGTLDDANYKTPYAEQTSLGVTRDLGANYSLDVAFTSTAGRHLDRPINRNPSNPALLVNNWRNAIAAVNAGLAPAATASVNSNPRTVATGGVIPCGNGPLGPYVTPSLLNSFRRSGLNPSLASFFTSIGAGGCVALANRIAALDGLGVGVPVPFGDITSLIESGSSSYNALSVNLNKRFSANYQFLISYTWSHALDDATDIVSGPDAPQNNFAPETDRSNSTFDQRHRLVLSGVYNSGHIGPGKLGNGFLPGVFSGFTVAPLIEVSSGRPFNIITGNDSNFDSDAATDRPNAVAIGSGVNGCGNAPVLSRYSPTGAFNLPCYVDAPYNASPNANFFVGNLSRNAGTKPFTVFTDLRIARAVSIHDKLTLEISADGFNLINKNNTLDVNTLYTAAGQEQSSSDPRQFQFGLRLSY